MSNKWRAVWLWSVAALSLMSVGLFSQASATIYCSGGACDGGPAENWMIGTDGWDLIESYDGRDHIWGKPTGDDLHGGADGDIIYGNSGNDVIRGQDGNDEVICTTLECGLDGGEGWDQIHGWVGFDTLIGGPGEDRMWGDDNADGIYAWDQERDVVVGGHGADVCRVDNFDVVQSC